MSWRSICIGFMAAIVPVVSVHADEIRGSHFGYGNWQGAAYTGDSGFSHCAIFTTYNSGIDLHFGIDNEYHWRIGFSHPQWSMDVGSTFTIRYQIDGFPPITASAIVMDPTFALAELIAEDYLFNQFRHGRALRLQVGSRTYLFSLKGSSRALNEALKCVNRYVGVQYTEPPVASQTQPQAVKPVEQETTIFATSPQEILDGTRFIVGLFSTSEFSGYHLLAPEEMSGPDKPEFLKNAVVAWSAPNLIGTLHILKLGDANPNDVVSELISADARECTGSFASGKTVAKENAQVVTLFSACQENTKYTFFNDYVAFQREPGTIYVITSVQLETEQVDRTVSETLSRNVSIELE